LYNSTLLSDCNRPEQIVVVGPSLKTPPIPAIQQLVCLPEQHEPPACIDTVGEQRLAGKAEHMRAVGRLSRTAKSWVECCDHLSCQVETLSGDARNSLVSCLCTM
ncbi:hypothetical protein, partial [Pseudomonas viridiflava]|uniref:hypothetical protein n=1 Tax=Pseudomonas viridiflava TaxID=33069 RepID=UPI0013CE77B1